MTSGDAFFEFTPGDPNKVAFCGLTHAATGTAFSEIDFGIKLTEIGVAEVRENNAYGVETIQIYRGLDPRFTRIGSLADKIAGALFGLTALGFSP